MRVLGKIDLPGDAIARVFGHLSPQGLLDAGFHLGCCRFGERDDEQLIDIAGIFRFANQMRAAFGENGGLARTGGGADEQAMPDRLDPGSLLIGPFRSGIHFPSFIRWNISGRPIGSRSS